MKIKVILPSSWHKFSEKTTKGGRKILNGIRNCSTKRSVCCPCEVDGKPDGKI